MKVRFLGESDPICFIHGHIYECLGKDDDKSYLYRIIDEEGYDEDEELQGYLYSLDQFEIVEE